MKSKDDAGAGNGSMIGFAAFDSDKEVFVNGKPVRTKADSLAFLCHEVSVTVLNEITTQRMMQKNL